MFDRLIKSGSVVDGTGAPARRMDVGIQDDFAHKALQRTADVVNAAFEDDVEIEWYDLSAVDGGKSVLRNVITQEEADEHTRSPIPEDSEYVGKTHPRGEKLKRSHPHGGPPGQS